MSEKDHPPDRGHGSRHAKSRAIGARISDNPRNTVERMAAAVDPDFSRDLQALKRIEDILMEIKKSIDENNTLLRQLLDRKSTE